MTPEPLSKAERAALAALGWRDRVREAGARLPDSFGIKLLYSQIDAIYSDETHAGARGDCPDFGSHLDPCPPGCAAGTCVALSDRRYPREDPPSGELIPAGQDEDLEFMGREIAEDPPQWYARTMADVRPGDTIRPLGIAGPESHVDARCWPPTGDARGRGSWHVIEGSDGHWGDHVVQPGECCLHLDGAGHRLFRPTFGVEILLSPSEVQAIELLGGWERRERMITE